MCKKALWYDQLQIILGARHCDVKQLTFLFDLSCRPSAEVTNTDFHSWSLAEWIVDKTRWLLVKQSDAWLVAGGIGRIERQRGKEAFTGRLA